MMEKDQKNSKDDFLEKFSQEASTPDASFREGLKSRILSKYEKPNLFFNLFAMSNKLKVAGLFLATAFFVLLLGGGGVLVYSLYFKTKPQVDTPKLDKLAILAKIAENNSPTTLNSKASPATANLNTQQLSGTSEADSRTSLSAESQMMPMPYFQEFSYSFDSYVTEYGDAKSKCDEGAFDYSMYYKSDSYYYNDPNDYSNYHSKSITYDKDGNIMNMYLSTHDESINYNGGKYAVKYIYDYYNDDYYNNDPTALEIEAAALQKEMPNEAEEFEYVEPENISNDVIIEDEYMPEYEEPSDMRFSDFFGDDVEVEEIEDEGKTAYLVTSNYTDDCSMYAMTYSSYAKSEVDASDKGDYDTVITQHYVKKDTYEIYKTISYLNEVTPSQMMYKSTTYTERKNVDFSEVAKNFEFGIDVPFKTFKSSQTGADYTQKYNQAVMDMVNSLDMTLLVSASQDLVFSSFYSPKIVVETEESLIYKDRDFYLDGPVGDKLFEQANMDYSDLYPSSLYSLSYNTQEPDMYQGDMKGDVDVYNSEYGYLSLEVYDAKTQIKDIIWSETYREEKTEILVDGKNLTVYKYYLQYPDVVYFDDTSSREGTSEKNYEDPIPVYIFEYKGYKYRINASYNSSSGEYENGEKYMVFKSLDLSNQANRDSFRQQVEKTLGGVELIVN
jgi:hypothetical protein